MKNNAFITNANDVFALLEGDIEKKMMYWDGSKVQSFVDNFSTDDFGEMVAWSENHAFGSVDSELFNEEHLTSDAKRLILGKFISDCLMMVTQGQTASDAYEQKAQEAQSR